jgi:hypothetical protein
VPRRRWSSARRASRIGLLGLVTLARAIAMSDPSPLFVYGRVAAPTGYANGDVALWFTGFLPCVFLAGRREVPVPPRPPPGGDSRSRPRRNPPLPAARRSAAPPTASGSL